MMELKINKSGQTPSKRNFQKLTTIEKILLAASCLDIKPNEEIYRLTLFGIVQTHIENLTEEALQGTLHKSIYFTRTSNGNYKLTQGGLLKIKEFENSNIKKISKSSYFKFIKNVGTDKYSVTIDSLNQKYIPEKNDEKFTSAEIVNFLSNKEINTKSDSKPLRLLNWIIQENYSWNIWNSDFYEEEDGFVEGKQVLSLHNRIERNRKVVDLLKANRLKKDPNLKCEICNFSFIEKYGDWGEGYIEAHHIKPLSTIKEETKTKIEDLILVCSNCHRMLHRIRPWKDSLNIIRKSIRRRADSFT